MQKQLRLAAIVFYLGLMTTLNASAQKYTSLSDTVKLNKEYGQLTLDLSKLNTRLITEKNKSAAYLDKIKSSTDDAMASGQKSKDASTNSTLGNVDDAKRNMKDAERANRDAKDAQSAREKLKENGKKIEALQDEINKKQLKIAALDSVKISLINQAAAAGSTTP